MQIEPWQIPILTMALLALPPSVHYLRNWLQRKSGPSDTAAPDDPVDGDPVRNKRRERLRTATLALVTVVLLGVFVVALGAEAASVLTSVATAVSTLVSAVMTVQSYLALQNFKREADQVNRSSAGSGTSEPVD